MSDTQKRDAVMQEFYAQAAATGLPHEHCHTLVVDSMTDEIVRLEHILAALRKPSEAVVESACLALYGAHNWAHNDPGDVVWRADARQRFITQLSAALDAAIEADEQEVGGE